MMTNTEEILTRSFENGMKNAIYHGVKLVFIMFLVFTLAQYFLLEQYKRDDTDSHDKRSGMVLRTDNATGCQYLETMGGGITPRLDKNGSHRGCYK